MDMQRRQEEDQANKADLSTATSQMGCHQQAGRDSALEGKDGKWKPLDGTF